MNKHPTEIAGMSPEELARGVASMKYDALATFLYALSNTLKDDADADRERGRRLLAETLNEASTNCRNAATDIRRSWRICEPHMSKNHEEQKY